MTSEEKLYRKFDEMGIKWEVHEHPAIFHVEEGDRLGVVFDGLNLKNLYIREKKKDDRIALPHSISTSLIDDF